MGKKKRTTNKANNRTTKSKHEKKEKRVKNSNSKALVRKKDVKMKFKYKHPKLALTLKIIFITLLLVFVVGAGVMAGLIFGLWGDDLNINLTELVLAENSIIVDSEGNTIAELSGDENRKIITLEEMSPYLPKAYIAIEDERFKTHHGVDLKRTGAAILSFVTNGGKSTAGGGSTITQQLVKNITQEKDNTGLEGITRKLKEWYRAYQIEDVLSKDQILELYLNLIFIGGNQDNRGVEIAAEYYFNKTAKDLSIAQCAFLAGINHSPNRYNPYNGNDVTEKITKRTKTVLSQMKKLEYINQEEYDAAIAEVDAGFKFENGVKGNIYSAHTDALITQLINQIMEEKQISKDAATTYLYSSGLKIYSTQVSSMQTIMEEEVKKEKYIEKSKENYNEDGTPKTTQTGVVVIQPSTGYVVGCVGQLGEKTTSRGLNRALSQRQTGSSFKPLADVLPGIEEGIITPATLYADIYTVFGGGYDPENYNGFASTDDPYRTVRRAITTSQNIPFIKVLAELGTEKSLEYLRKMGFTTLDDVNDATLPLAIGGLHNGVSPLEMAAAYAMISNDGVYIEPTFYSKVEDSEGKVVLEPNQKTERVCSVQTAYIVKNLLTSVVKDSGGTATYCAIKGMDVAAKTGTTNSTKDRWLCGFTNYYACAVWYGYDTPERIRTSSSKSSGLIFSTIMKEFHKDLEGSTFKEPENIVHAKVCRTSGLLATDKCSNTYSEVFIKGQLPNTCEAHQGQYTICTESGKLANEFCPADKKEIKDTGYIPEKERLGLWNTAGLKKVTPTPTEYCTIHKKVEVVKPEEPEEKPEQKPEQKPEEKPDEKPEQKPEEKPENPSGGNSDNGNSSGGSSNSGNSNSGNSSNGNGNTSSGSGNNENNSGQNKPQT